MTIKKTLAVTTLILAITTSIVLAGGLGQNDHKKNGPPPTEKNQHSKPSPPARNAGGFQRPVELIGPELGLTGTQFAKCFENVSPAPRGTTPTKARERANKAVLLPCLQAINPAITNDLLDSVTNKYRPKN